jgi:hypothetical protein
LSPELWGTSEKRMPEFDEAPVGRGPVIATALTALGPPAEM